MILAFDTETFPICAEARFPKLVCLSYCEDGKEPVLLTDVEMSRIRETVRRWLTNESITLVGHNVGFDLHVIRNTFPDLEPLIWSKLEAGQITDTLIREKLLNLSTSGKMDEIMLPDGKTQMLKYNLGDLVQQRLGEDISEDKHGEESWRVNYHLLSGFREDEYPEDAARYAKNDAYYTYLLFLDQNERAKTASVETEFFQTAIDFALKYLTDRGLKIDQEGVHKLLEKLQAEIAPEKLTLLVESGILRPAEPPRPHKRNPNKMTKGKPPSINRKVLLSVVEQVASENGVPLRRTDKGAISADAEMIKELAEFSPVLAQYQNRQKIYRLISTELPKLDAPEVFPEYDCLKETGRTSSYGGKLYPSTNIQQVDPRARHLFLPRSGCVLCSIDYDAIELVSLAQTLLDLFGHSTLAELLKQGVDPHAYLGAHLAVHLDPTFRDLHEGLPPMELYKAFKALKDSDREDDREFYAHWRKFAKPTGLGYPGGLGAATMVEYAKATYDVQVTIEEAEVLKELWFKTFPEMREYFRYINQIGDANDEFRYVTPMGMVRAGATYCAAANGIGLQSRTAEGAKMAVFEVVRASYDWTKKSILYGQGWPLAFIHDEIILEIKEDRLMSDVADEAARIWRESMQRIMPDIPVRAEPALMRRWNKKAETVRDASGRLQVWEEPKDESSE